MSRFEPRELPQQAGALPTHLPMKMANNNEPFFVRPEGSASDTDSTGSADTDCIWIELTVNVKPKHSLTGEIPHSIRFRHQNVNILSRRALSADSDSQKHVKKEKKITYLKVDGNEK
jgi:hypothetical protein